MKILLKIIIILAIILGGGYFALKQYAPEVLEKYLPQIESIISEKVDKLTELEETADEFCVRYGGVVQEYEKDDGTMQRICFVNDGKDGVRCDLDLFFKRECGTSVTGDVAEESADVEPTVLINSNEDSPLAMLSVNEEGIAVALYTRQHDGGEVVDYFVVEAKGESPITVYVDEVGIVKELHAEGYKLIYSNFDGETIDLTVIHPDGTREEEKGMKIGEEELSWIPSVYASDQALMHYMNRNKEEEDRGDHSDGKYYSDVIGTAWNSLICFGGLVTNIIPNPVSILATAVGCGTLVSRVVPGDMVADECGEKSVFDCIVSVVNKPTDENPYFNGQAYEPTGDHLLPDVKLTFTHKGGKSLIEYSDKYGGFSVPLELNGTIYITAEKQEFKTANYTMVVSDQWVKVQNYEGKIIYEHPNKPGNLPPFNFNMPLAGIYESTFTTRDPLNMESGFYNELIVTLEIEELDETNFTCFWEAKGTMDYYSDSSGPIKGPIEAYSDTCSGKLEGDQISLSGVAKGNEPLPELMTEEKYKAAEEFLPDMYGPMKSVPFTITGTIDKGGIKGLFNFVRISLMGPDPTNRFPGLLFIAN